MFDPKTGRQSAKRQEIIKFLKPLTSQHTCFLPDVWAEVYGEARNHSIPLCAWHDSTHQLSHNSNPQTAGVTELANPTRRKAPASHLTPLFTPEFPEVLAQKKEIKVFRSFLSRSREADAWKFHPIHIPNLEDQDLLQGRPSGYIPVRC